MCVFQQYDVLKMANENVLASQASSHRAEDGKTSQPHDKFRVLGGVDVPSMNVGAV